MTDPQDDSMNDVHALSGAYAVDALDPGERVRFELHLAHCAECRSEVDGLREAAARLGSGADVAPPPALRGDILAAIETVRPLPPLTAAGTSVSSESSESTVPLVPSVSGVSAERADQAERGERGERAADAQPDPAGPVPIDRARGRWARGAPYLLIAAAVAAIAVLGAAIWQPWVGDGGRPTPTATERVLTADDAARTVLDLPDGAEATLVVSRSEGRAVILTEDMPPAPAGKDYELWLQTPQGDLRPAGCCPTRRTRRSCSTAMPPGPPGWGSPSSPTADRRSRRQTRSPSPPSPANDLWTAALPG